MRSIFESERDFEEAYMDFKVIKTNFALSKLIIKKLSNKREKPAFIWQMQGNQVVPTIMDIIESFNDDTEYQTVNKDITPAEFVLDQHVFESQEEANVDTSRGVYIVVNFTYMSPKMRNFIVSTIKGESGYYLGSGWRFVVTGNIDDGDSAWMPEFWDIFENVEFEPVPVSVMRYDDPDFDGEDEEDNNYNDEEEEDDEEFIPDDEMKDFDINGEYYNESAYRRRRGARPVYEAMTSNYHAMSLDELKDEVYSILYDAAMNGEISPYEYIYIDDDSVIVDSISGFDRDMMKHAKRADLFIDFDALDDGEVIIYTRPLYRFIEENVF